jgi:hypothetical protein
VPLLFGQGESDVDAAGRRLRIFASAGGDDHILTTVHFVSGGSGVARERQRGLPQQSASGFIESAKFFVEAGGADEDQAAGGYDGAAVIFGAGIFHSLHSEFREFAEVDAPEVLTGGEIDGVEGAPGRGDGGIAVGIEEAAIPGEAIFHSEKLGAGAGKFFAIAMGEKIYEIGQLWARNVGKTGHAAFAGLDGRGNLIGSEASSDAN